MGEIIQFGDISKRKLADNNAVDGNFIQVMFYTNELDVVHRVCEKYKPVNEEYTVKWIAFGALSEAIEDIISEETSESFLAAPEVPMCTHILEIDVYIDAFTKEIEIRNLSPKELSILERIRKRLKEFRDLCENNLSSYAMMSEYDRTTILADDWIKYNEKSS
ncbi:hypothetical protein Cpap_0436 [Ruminiclostridium papyrosolvens DSM 2782]|uniref:Uncharacterized protein n=1 Tax=Ruminiclostridium papyrosolvens DSM 2782 TaxID=588581 RepID=F1THD9_9FIRM|nr:hypothetical protein [Ruminiclostridium papyrosolvens]EGD46142.1 hypothetical protein Cpap_0436 [Ruminiclostridium papyrosolvens DSM 2782]WES35927.1 hypothetical protein P0092_08180 [Ruminiclostridium papyrosolvens DSM 2782]